MDKTAARYLIVSIGQSEHLIPNYLQWQCIKLSVSKRKSLHTHTHTRVRVYVHVFVCVF